MALELFSPAKLNLNFRVLQRRPDGYHEIDTLMQAVDLGDTLTLSYHDKQGDHLTCTDPSLPTDEQNLVLKACQLFKAGTGITDSFFFHLEKTIPVMAGLGGGSSNAATALWGLNQLTKSHLSDAQLVKIGSQIGADVSFFFSCGRARCRGIGEKVEPLPMREKKQLWVAKPREGLATKEVFAALKSFEGTNHLEAPAFALMPKLAELKNQLLSHGFSQVQMTGSGTSFFCIGDVPSPQIPEVTFFRVQFHSRAPSDWYKFP